MQVTCQTGECPIILNSKCVIYEGEALVYTGINTNDTIQTVIQKLNTFLSTTNQGEINSGNGITVSGNSVNLGGPISSQVDFTGTFPINYLTGSIQSLSFNVYDNVNSRYARIQTTQSNNVNVTIPNLAGVAGSFVINNLTQTLTNKTLTNPILTSTSYLSVRADTGISIVDSNSIYGMIITIGSASTDPSIKASRGVTKRFSILGSEGEFAGSTVGGDLLLKAGIAVGGNGNGGDLFLEAGNKNGSGLDGNIGILTETGSFGGGEKVIFIHNATTVPSSNPTDGGILFVEGGALKFRGSSGTISTIAPA